MRQRKLFIGQFIRQLRGEHDLTQAAFAKKISISTSYLNQLENNQKHVSASVLLSLAEEFGVDIAAISDNDSDRLLADLKEVLADPMFKGQSPSNHDLRVFAQTMPSMAKTFLTMHQSARKADERLAEIDDSLEQRGTLNEPTPYEEVRDFFHYQDNYIDVLDRAAENLSAFLGANGDDKRQSFVQFLADKHNVKTSFIKQASGPVPIRHYDKDDKSLFLSGFQPRTTHTFHLAHQIAMMEQRDEINKIVGAAGFRSTSARKICQIGLANYFAGALVMPYGAFLDFAAKSRHDLQILSRHFEVSLEQAAHRLSNLQRPRKKGVPFFFARVDQAGNITKRHSATKLQFARFGSTCPLWNVHAAFASPGKIVRQLAQTPDGEKYLCLAFEVVKPGSGYQDPSQKYALALGCEITHAKQLVYSEGLDVTNEANYEPIGISCRICDRVNCHQRAVPPLRRELIIDENERDTIPYRF